VLADGGLPDIERARAAVAPVPAQLPTVTVNAPDLAAYDGLLREPAVVAAAVLPWSDAAKLPLMLGARRLATIGRLWQEFVGQADREGWGAARFLATVCEHELAERAARRIARHLAQSDLPAGNTLTSFDFAATPSLRKAHLAALAPAMPGSSRAPTS
jgi:hypothetical protein